MSQPLKCSFQNGLNKVSGSEVYRSDGPSFEDQEMLAEFQADTYLYWE